MAHIRLENISKKFGGHTALSGLDLEIADGEFFVLLGETGAGKTTTLRLIAGLEKPTEGRVLIDGVDVAEWGAAERDVALVLQQYSLYPRYTVRENLEFPLRPKIRRLPEDEIRERVARAAKTPRIEHLLDRKTDRLSGGEMQRVSIGRAIVRKPRVFLMDEPLSALDAKLRESLRTDLKSLQVQLGATFLFVTHDQIEAMSMGDKVGVLNHGRIVQSGTPQEIYERPATRFVADFVGSSNVLPPDFVQRWSGQHRWASLRPEAIRVGSTVAGEGVPARLVSTNYLGATTKLLLDAEGLRLHATVPAGAALPEPGEEVTLTFNREHLHLMEEGA